MTFEVTFDDQPYPLPPELVPQSLGLLPSDTGPDKLALFEAVGRLQRDLSRLSGRLQLNIKSQQEGMMKVEEALGGVEARFREQSLIKPPPPPVIQNAGVTLDQLNPHLEKLSEQLITIQRKVNPLAEQLEGVKGSYKDKVEEGQIERILPVLDSFERLFEQAGQSDDPKMQKWLEGVRMIHNQLRSYLRGQGVEEIPALGEVFDPNIFAAVGTDPTDEYEPNRISRVGRTGYRRNTESGGPPKLLRVPEVFVAKPKTEEMRLGESQLTRAELLARQQQEAAAEVATPPPAAPPVEPVAAAPVVIPTPVTKPAPPKPHTPKTKAKPAVGATPVIAEVAPSIEMPAPAPIDSAPTPTAEPTVDPASITVGGGEDKFADIRAKAEAALKGLFEPEAKIDSVQPTVASVPDSPTTPSPAPPPTQSPMASWGSLGAEAEMPATPPALPPNEQPETTVVGAGPALDGGNEEYFANGDAVYELRMETGLTMVAFWAHAFGKQIGEQQLMDLGEAVEREEESIDDKELKKLAQGLGIDVDDLRKRFRTG